MINMKKTCRIYDEPGLQLCNKHPKRRVKAKLREDRQEAVGPNDAWAMDFAHDPLATGQKLRVLTVIDTFPRFMCRCSMFGSTVAGMWSQRWTECTDRRAIRRLSEVIRAPSACLATWNSGPVNVACL